MAILRLQIAPLTSKNQIRSCELEEKNLSLLSLFESALAINLDYMNILLFIRMKAETCELRERFNLMTLSQHRINI